MNMDLRLMKLCMFACVSMHCVRVRKRERERRQAGRDEKPVAVFRECVKRICQRDAHRMDYAEQRGQVISPVLISEKDGVDDEIVPVNFFMETDVARKKARREKMRNNDEN